MRILVVVLLLVGLGTSVGMLSWRYRYQLLVIFGLAKAESHEDQVQDMESFRAEEPAPAKVASAGNSGKDQSQPPGTGSGQRAVTPVEPMIIVAQDGSRSRCDPIAYDNLAQACGQWATEQLLGSGGTATVFRADLPKFGRVAVKRFATDSKESGREWARELEALCSCRHPSILEIVGYSCEGPENLIVMPLMEGGTLSGALPLMPWAPRACVTGQIVRAVAFLHGKKIVHRDIKTTNILLDRSLRMARLADFGLAKEQVHVASHGTTGIVRGSPGYMAPELMMRPANDKTDAFALGVVFLEVLSGLPAWDASEDGGMALTDRAVEDGVFVEGRLDRTAEWPAPDAKVVSEQAVALTLFDPGRRRTPVLVEQDASYVSHLARAEQADAARRSPCAAVVGAAQT